MSSSSSDIDVVTVQLSHSEEENTSVLHAYEPNSTSVNDQESVQSDITVVEEKPKTIQDVLSHCQDIHIAVQKLDKKFDIINGKVTKIHRTRVKSWCHTRKTFGYAYRRRSFLISRKTRFRKIKKRVLPLSPSSTSRPISYSPTSPVARPPNFPIYDIGSPNRSEDSLERTRESLCEDQELSLSHSPSVESAITDSCYSYYSSNDGMQSDPNFPCFSSPGAKSNSSILSVRASTSMSAPVLGECLSTPIQDPYSSFLEDRSLDRVSSGSFDEPTSFSPTSPVKIDRGMLQHSSYDPSTWSITDVILFLKQMDPQMSDLVTDLFREHDIDGKALLLLNSDMMIKYMGLKLGTAVKVCYYIEKLKENTIITPEKSFM